MADKTKAASKPPLSKEELRRMMKEKSSKKIDSPLAKYDNSGKLFCIPCKCQVKSEASWIAHISGRQHQQVLNSMRNATIKTAKSPGSPFVGKRPTDSSVNNSSKKMKSVMRESADDVEMSEASPKPATSNVIPSDFFDSPSRVTSAPAPVAPITDPPKGDIPTLLPDDFFDNPTKNIKQKQEREKQKQEEDEWNRFQKAMQEESHKSAMVVEHDDKETRTQKELDEIEEQMERWRKIHDLEVKQEQVNVKKTEIMDCKPSLNEESERTSSDDEDLELMDWRKRNLW